MFNPGEQINRILSYRSKILISDAVLKSLQIRFKVTEKSLKQYQPFSKNIMLMLMGFSEIGNPRRSLPAINPCKIGMSDFITYILHLTSYILWLIA